jgi:hypothetical protein
MFGVKSVISNRKLWVYRILVAVAAGLMLASFIMPWWTADIFSSTQELNKDGIRIYGWGLQHNFVALRDYILQDETPVYQIVLAWIYMGLNVSLIMFSTWIKGNKGRWILLGIGLAYIIYALVATHIVIANRLAEYGFSLEGWNYFQENYGTSAGIKASLRFGYYLACIAGGMSVALALLHGIFQVKSGREGKNRQRYKTDCVSPQGKQLDITVLLSIV